MEGGGVLVKVGLFLVVQLLVYFIVSNSPGVFSKPARSVSFRRLMSVLSDLPAGDGGRAPPTISKTNLKRSSSQLKTSSYDEPQDLY